MTIVKTSHIVSESSVRSRCTFIAPRFSRPGPLGQVIVIFDIRPPFATCQVPVLGANLGVCLPLSPRHGVRSRSSPFRSATASIAKPSRMYLVTCGDSSGIRCHGRMELQFSQQHQRRTVHRPSTPIRPLRISSSGLHQSLQNFCIRFLVPSKIAHVSLR